MKKTTKTTKAGKPPKKTNKAKILTHEEIVEVLAKSLSDGAARKATKPAKVVPPMDALGRLAKKDPVAAEFLRYVHEHSLDMTFTVAAEHVALRHDGPMPSDFGKFLPDNLFEVVGEMNRMEETKRANLDKNLGVKLDYAIIRSPAGVNLYDQYPRKGVWKCVSSGTLADREQIVADLLRILKDDAGYTVKTKGRGSKATTVLESVGGKTRKELLRFLGMPENGDPNGLLNKAIGGVNHAYIVVLLDLYRRGDHPNGNVRASWVIQHMRRYGNA